MAEYKIGSAKSSEIANIMTEYSVPAETIDGATDQPETKWENLRWTQYLAYFKKIPELQAVINAKANWTVGKGFQAIENVDMDLSTITGWGKDTFNTILENMIRTYHIGGDAYCLIIPNDDGGLLNLKPLDPGVMAHIVDRSGQIIRYEQRSKIKGTKPKKYEPEKIFHLARNRLADEIHGVSTVEAVEWVILARNEAMESWKRVLLRNIDPLWIFHLATEDDAEIAAFKAKQDKARGSGENMYVPKDVIVPELQSVAPNATLNALPWIEVLNDYFYEASGVPRFIVGGVGGLTEAAVKTSYLAFQQNIEAEQLFIEESILQQLNIAIELEFPASMENELLSDQKKDKETGVSKPSDTVAGEKNENKTT